MAVNRIIDNAGASFFPELMVGTGRTARAIAEAYFMAAAAGDIAAIQRELYALEDKHRQAAIYDAMDAMQDALEAATFFILESAGQMVLPEDASAQAQRLLEHVETLLPISQRPVLARHSQELEKLGIPAELALRVARLAHLPAILESVAMAGETGRAPREVMRLRLEIAREMNLGQLQEALAHMVYRSRWEGPAAQALSRHLNSHLRTMVRAVEGDDVAGMVQRLKLDAVRKQGAANLEGGVSIAGIVMFDHHLRRLLAATIGS